MLINLIINIKRKFLLKKKKRPFPVSIERDTRTKHEVPDRWAPSLRSLSEFTYLGSHSSPSFIFWNSHIQHIQPAISFSQPLPFWRRELPSKGWARSSLPSQFFSLLSRWCATCQSHSPLSGSSFILDKMLFTLCWNSRVKLCVTVPSVLCLPKPGPAQRWPCTCSSGRGFWIIPGQGRWCSGNSRKLAACPQWDKFGGSLGHLEAKCTMVFSLPSHMSSPGLAELLPPFPLLDLWVPATTTALSL